jgi:hypothetical protein
MNSISGINPTKKSFVFNLFAQAKKKKNKVSGLLHKFAQAVDCADV